MYISSVVAILATIAVQTATASMQGSFRSPDKVRFCKATTNDCTKDLQFNYNECTTLVDSDIWGTSNNRFEVVSQGNSTEMGSDAD